VWAPGAGVTTGRWFADEELVGRGEKRIFASMMSRERSNWMGVHVLQKARGAQRELSGFVGVTSHR